MRRIWVILLTLLGCILVTLGLCVGFLHSGKIQTATVRLATDELSRGLNTTVRIGGVRYEFPMRITLNDIYIEDLQQDTLLYIRLLYTRFSPLALTEKQLRFPTINLDGVRADIHRLPSGEYNYMFLVRAFASGDTTKSPLDLDIQLRNIALTDVKARYDSFAFDLPQAGLALHHFSWDSLDAEIRQMALSVDMVKARHQPFSRFSEQLVIKDVAARLIANDTIIVLPTLELRLPQSHLDASGVHTTFPRKPIEQSFGNYFRENADAIRMSLHINNARLTPQDLKFFLKDFSGVKGTLTFSADLEGTMDSIAADNLELFYDNRRVFLGSFSAIGLPVLDNVLVHARCQDLSLTNAQIQDFVSGIQGRPFRLPPVIRRLGDMHYQGELRGRLHDLTLHGAFRTALGVITTDGTCLSARDFSSATLKGKLGTKRFNLGRLLANRNIGTVSMTVNTDWHLATDTTPHGKADVHISQIAFNGYRYKDIKVHATLDDLFAQGNLKINDQNICLALEGIADLKSPEKHVDATLDIRRFFPGTLKLTKRYPDSELNGKAKLHFLGHDIDHADIALDMDSLFLRIGTDSAMMKALSLTSGWQGDNLVLRLQSDYFTGTAKGRFAYTTLPVSVMKQIAHYLPSVFSTKRYKQIMARPSDNELTLYLYGHKIHKLQEMLQLPVMISDDPVIKASFNERRQRWSVQTYIPGVLAGNALIKDIALNTSNTADYGSLDFSMELDSTVISAQTQAFNDSLLLGINFKALPPSKNFGTLDVQTHFMHYAGRPLVEAHILPGLLQLGDSLYHIGDSRIAFCAADTSLTIDAFRLTGKSQYIEADGVASPRETDSLHIALERINARLLMPFLLPDKAFTAGGRLTGWANIFGLFNKPVFEAEVRLDSALLCNSHIGDAVAKVELDRSTGNITIDANVDNGTHRVAHVDGLAEPKKGRFMIDIFPDSIPLGFINHWTSGFLSDISGFGSGRVTVSGEGKKVWVITRVKGIDAGLTIPFTGCRYTFNDSVFMDSTSIIFPDLVLRDEEGNPFYFNGRLTHDEYFRNFRLDLAGRCDHTLAINLPDEQGRFMSGKIYADGDIFLEGPDNDIVLTADAKAVGKSRFRISIDGASSASDNSFITFYNHNVNEPVQTPVEQLASIIPKRKKAAQSGTSSRFRLGLNVDIDPQTLFQLVLNERTGDMIQARGDGSIKFTMNDATDEYHLLGTYTLQSGKLGFTIGNVIRRDFTIAEGSQIIWNGVAEEPILNVTAKYQVTASLKDLFGTETQNLVSGRTSIPVLTVINLTGPLSDPIIRFDIELPRSEETIANQVKSVINTDEMMMRQVVYLLVFGRFFTPEYMRNTTNAGVNETYSLLSSTITGQINAWLGKLTNVFTLGFNFRSDGQGSDSQQEYEAVFSLQPVDRLVINGNFGYRYNDISNRPFFGDLDIEYFLTPNGKLRIKGYTHSVDKYSLKQATMVEGVGVVFKHDFNWKKE